MRDYTESFSYSLGDKYEIEDLDNRRLFLNGEIDENTVSYITYHILRYNREDENRPANTRQPIVLFINSPGGSIPDGLSICSAISCSETPVFTVNIGRADSMAFLIFIVGWMRFSLPYSEFMLHDGLYADNDSVMKVQDRLGFYSGQLTGLQQEIILSSSKLTESEYHSNLRKDWYMLPQEAKKLGFVDNILGVDCKLDAIYTGIEKEKEGE